MALFLGLMKNHDNKKQISCFSLAAVLLMFIIFGAAKTQAQDQNSCCIGCNADWYSCKFNLQVCEQSLGSGYCPDDECDIDRESCFSQCGDDPANFYCNALDGKQCCDSCYYAYCDSSGQCDDDKATCDGICNFAIDANCG
ncbi:OLC1v1004096C1 [Oldenlandia corymbosa var. corymbosa]|uniref:OLC1v1004096C1 n=1 Tax=Oldenlandia corymbosa var. corymbosa TaxID=529605 RepID=A0AAV1DE76_OLDCO|nr:OLC1v1004096C1 [Oldenlandia corymbosa var. corymbosa]